MPVTSGTLTARLVQLVDDVGGFFTDVTNHLQTIAENTTEMRADLTYLLQSGDGTPRNRNIQTLSDEIYELGGPRNNHATLRELYDALGSDADTISIRQSLFNLMDNALIQDIINLKAVQTSLAGPEGGPSAGSLLESIKGALLSLIGPDESSSIYGIARLMASLNAPEGGPTAGALLEMIQACICELNEKTPPLEEPPAEPGIIPASHMCAPSQQLLFEIKPSDWYEWSPGFWRAAPAALYAGMEDWERVTKTANGTSGVAYPVIRLKNGALWEDAIKFCRVTADTSTEIYVLDPLHGRDQGGEGTGDLAFSIGADVPGVSNSATGCRTIALLSSDPDEQYWALNNNPGGSDPSDRILNTLYFYAVPPS